MSKFKVGDKVIGNDPHRYAITNEGWRGEVVGLEGSMIAVSNGGSTYWVNPEFFDLVHPASLPVTVITTDGVTTTATLREGKRTIRTASAKCSPDDTFDYATGAKLAFDRLFPETAETKMFKVGDRVWDVNKKSYATIIRVDEKDDVVPYKIEDADGNTHWRCKQNVVPCGPDAEPPKPKYYTGKMVCIKSGYSWWTVGKVYDIVDGTITADDGYKYRGYISAEDARHVGGAIGGTPFPGSDAGHNPDNEFIPFVES